MIVAITRVRDYWHIKVKVAGQMGEMWVRGDKREAIASADRLINRMVGGAA